MIYGLILVLTNHSEKSIQGAKKKKKKSMVLFRKDKYGKIVNLFRFSL